MIQWVKATVEKVPDNPDVVIRNIKWKYTVNYNYYSDGLRFGGVDPHDYEWLSETPDPVFSLQDMQELFINTVVLVNSHDRISENQRQYLIDNDFANYMKEKHNLTL